MGREVECNYLVKNDLWRREADRGIDTGKDICASIRVGVCACASAARKPTPTNCADQCFDSVRRGLLTRKWEQQEDVTAVLRKIATELKAAGKRAKRWPLATDGFPALESGLEKMFRKSRALSSRNPRGF